MKTFSLALAVSAIALFTFAPLHATSATKCPSAACKKDMSTHLKKHFKKATTKKHATSSAKKKATSK